MKNIDFIVNNNSNSNNNHPQFPPDDVDVDEDDDVEVEDDDVDEDSTSSADPPIVQHHHHHHSPPLPQPLPFTSSSAAGQVTVALPNSDHRLQDVTIAAAAGATTVVEEKKPFPIDDSRKLFQRLWTDEDEMKLLHGFLEYTKQRGGGNNSSHHHDTAVFYDQIKCKLQLDFNKNQLVEKLRRLKKKYRNITQKMTSGKEYVFKSPHDRATFEISKKIWSGMGGAAIPAFRSGGGGGSTLPNEAALDDDDQRPNPNPNPNATSFNSPLVDYSPILNGVEDRKIPIGSRKRSRGGGSGGGEISTTPQFNQQQPQPVTVGVATGTTTATATNVIEETVRSCLSPVLKELLQSVINLNTGPPQGLGGLALSPMPLGSGLGIGSVDVADERWRKQQILELEVFSKRLELVQDQIKGRLEELRGKES